MNHPKVDTIHSFPTWRSKLYSRLKAWFLSLSKRRKFIICKEKCADSSIIGTQLKMIRYLGMCVMHDTQNCRKDHIDGLMMRSQMSCLVSLMGLQNAQIRYIEYFPTWGTIVYICVATYLRKHNWIEYFSRKRNFFHFSKKGNSCFCEVLSLLISSCFPLYEKCI